MGCGHAPGAWVVTRGGVATCCRCGVRRFTAYGALWREVPGPAEVGPTASATGTGVLSFDGRRRKYVFVRWP
ncbi:DUF6255 family natural product biosynthesis protein [Streptomyces sp. I05A-00742]|uniref:DUF6255 family natural product biosynthesis protein n=1 Tax=Streptomyces sp. I05A-00742 TaxID=2732853 RepID=UPI00148A101B|nr:DUF6255 family natural product biosynthesis protein [Streptomyces sp. I05A-00742]